MAVMNSEVYDALVSAGGYKAKAREPAKSTARYGSETAEIMASLLPLQWMVGLTLAIMVALVCRAFQ